MLTTGVPTTARDLASALRPFRPMVEEGDLGFDLDPPEALEPVLDVLHSGVRALLSGRRWWATVEGGRAGRFTRVRVVELNPGEQLPAGTTLLSVEGDQRWDRLDPCAHLDHPELFGM